MTSASISTVFYLDASALVKRYATETGSSWVLNLCDPSSGNTVATARVTKAEAAAAFAGKHRDGGLTQAHYTSALQDLNHDFTHQYLLVDIDQALIDLAVNLTKRQKLRGYDAIQLAAALTLNNVLTQAQLPALTFVAADNDLLKAAQGEGLGVENPNQYP